LHRWDRNDFVRLKSYGDQLLRLRKRQRLQQYCIENGKDGRRSANAKRKRQHRGSSEPGTLPKLPKRISKK
jgi:hypothetical protein